ncbi:5-oxoprolinase subunit A OS=Rhodanobacter lindaniclasticus OX=75310 GN=pxpA PE=3 SV=1 [Rhodanobacter lindaniclasticus]
MVAEAFADRRYRTDGTLQPRGEAGAVIDDAEIATAQALQISEGTVTTTDGNTIGMRADTSACTATSHAVPAGTPVRAGLEAAGASIAAPGDA